METSQENPDSNAAVKPASELRKWAPLAAALTLIAVIIAAVLIFFPTAAAPLSKAQVDASVKSDVRNTVKSVAQWEAQDPANQQLLIDNATTFAKADVSNKVFKTQPGAIIGVYAQGDGTYTVCGFNPAGSQYTTSRKALGYDSTNGIYAPVMNTQPSQDCVGAIDARGNDAS